MLIPDLLNILLDQSDYSTLTVLRSLNKRKTKYANKYSLLRYYETHVIKTINRWDAYYHGNIKKIKFVLTCIHRDELSHENPIICYTVLVGIRRKYMHHCNDAMQWSAANYSFESVRYLASVGANIDTAVEYSAEYGNMSMVKYLISIGADVHSSVDRALRWSAKYGHLDVVKYLIKNGANVNAHYDDAIQNSVENGHLETIKYLVSVGANVRACNDFALRICAMRGRMEIAKYLVSVGANINACNGEFFNYAMVDNHFGHLRHT